MRVKADEVAERAGVSRSTVSRALRGLSNVSEDTRQRVMAAADELQYRPMAAASHLASGRTGAVGVTVPAFDKWYFTEVVAAAERVLRPHSLDLVLYHVETDEQRRFLTETAPYRNRVDGLILVAVVPDATEAAYLRRIGAPVVTIGAESTEFSSVGVEDRAGAARAAVHLANLGHRRLALLIGPIDESVRHEVLRERRAGFTETATAMGCTVSEVVAEMTLAGGAEAMTELLSRPEAPTGIFACSDEMAVGALKTARDAGLDVPGHLSVIGFDNSELATILDLTTVDQEVPSHGESAAELLIDLIENPGGERRHRRMSTHLVIRKSTAPPMDCEGAAPFSHHNVLR